MSSKPKHDLPVNVLEEKLLESAGVLRENPECPAPGTLSDKALDLFLLIAGSGENGLSISSLPRKFRKTWESEALELELHNFIARERNARGQHAYLTLTWRGQDVLEQARALSQQKPDGWGKRRKHALA